jgi:hypothetical protein
MKHNSILHAAGTSATGKGTRVSQLLHFLISKYDFEFRSTIIIPENDEVAPYYLPLGILIPELNTLFLGKIVKSNKSGLLSWSSLDYLHGKLGMDATAKLVYSQLKNSLNIVQEGYVGSGNSIAYGPVVLSEYTQSILLIGYDYKGVKSDMMDRIVSRSSKECKGDAAWSQRSLGSAYIYSCSKQVDLVNNCGVFTRSLEYDAPLTQLGNDWLTFQGEDELQVEFSEWSEDNSTLRDFRDKQSNLDIWSDMFDRSTSFASELKDKIFTG